MPLTLPLPSFGCPRGSSACALVLLVSLAAACGDDDSAAPLDPSPVAGTAAVFDLDANRGDAGPFYALPYPGDLRTDPEGLTSHVGFPSPNGNRVLRPVLLQANQRRGAPVTPFAYFRFDGPIAERRASDVIAPSVDAPVLLIGIEPGSRDYERLLPTIASTPPVDAYVPPNLLAVAAPPGWVLAANSTYAFVVLRSLGDAAGMPLGVSAPFAQLRAGLTPEGSRGAAAAAIYGPLWSALRDAGVDVADVAAATVFSTVDAVTELAELSERLRDLHPLSISNLRVDPADGADHSRFCEVQGETRVPMFQRGTPPYDREGLFAYDDDGLPIVQDEQIVPLVITLPRTPMPAGGYPLTLYFHGTSGHFDQVVDRGPVAEVGGPQAKGRGPAHVLAEHGIATFGAALPLNVDRYGGPAGLSNRSYLNISNLGAYGDTFRQMTIEQRLLLDALAEIEVDPQIVAACGLPAPPAGTDGYRLATDEVYLMGQSLGGQIVNMVGAVEPRVVGVAPTGSGGYWSLTVRADEFAPGLPADAAIALLLQVPTVRGHLHPGLQLVQSVFEPAEPVVYAARLARDPLTGHEPRAVYQAIAIDDPGFPNVIYNAMALASGTVQAGTVLDAGLQQVLALDGREGVLAYDVTGNARSVDGRSYTGVVAQYASDELTDGHHIFAQLDAVKFQYGCFLRSLVDGGAGVVAAPAPLGSGCP